ncbi:unnamed protein product [Cuscuta campestris]|uniref:Uncharacterized protein n=1 Tax=Cuscuta campestris TaxID=132261 RepID=A0A484N8B7_9ASTE|nr:unnamed protein product [Cuscuta campestris]
MAASEAAKEVVGEGRWQQQGLTNGGNDSSRGATVMTEVDERRRLLRNGIRNQAFQVLDLWMHRLDWWPARPKGSTTFTGPEGGRMGVQRQCVTEKEGHRE